MHTLHFILLNADSAQEAARTAASEILHWGDDSNWRSIGGVASEDGSDDVENQDDGRWPLSFLDAHEGLPKEGTSFQKAVAYVRRMIEDPITLRDPPHEQYPNLRAVLHRLAEQLLAFDPDTGSSHELWAAQRTLKQMEHILDGRGALRSDCVPEFYAWQLDHEGLTDMTWHTHGAKRFLVLLDMHS